MHIFCVLHFFWVPGSIRNTFSGIRSFCSGIPSNVAPPTDTRIHIHTDRDRDRQQGMSNCAGHDSSIPEKWLIHMCDVRHSLVRCEVFICVSHIWVSTHASHVFIHMSHICVMCICIIYVIYTYHLCMCDTWATWLIHMCDMTHCYVWHDAWICVTWLIDMCVMTHSCMWHDSLIRVTWLVRVCDTAYVYVVRGWFVRAMTHLYVWRGSFVCVTCLHASRHVTHISESCHTYESSHAH